VQRCLRNRPKARFVFCQGRFCYPLGKEAVTKNCAVPWSPRPTGPHRVCGELASPGVGRAAVSGGDVVSAVAHRVPEAQQYLVQSRRRLVPFRLFEPIRLGRFTSPDLLKRGDLCA
jgi:hypothetical protein